MRKHLPVSHKHPAVPKRRVGYGLGGRIQAWEALTGVYRENVKINTAYYKTEVLEKVVAPALRDLYGKHHCVFQ